MDMNNELEENIVARLNLFEEEGVTEFTPLDKAVDEYIDFAQHPEKRVWTGLEDIDRETRGLAPGELCVINGFAHNGKTVLVVELLIKNEGRPCILFTPDETRTAVLIKLTAALYGVGAEDLERRINLGDQESIELLRTVAKRFHNLAVFDENISLHRMDTAFDSVTEAIGRPEFCVFDYADLLNADMETNEKLKALKRWGKEKEIPFFVLHQSSRSGGAGGKAVTMTSGAYGGEQQAFIMIGVRRKINMLKDQVATLEERLERTENEKTALRIVEKINDIKHNMMPKHVDTISISLVKNKRPPMRLVDDTDFKLDRDTGRLIAMGGNREEYEELPLTSSQIQAKEPVRSGSARDLLRKNQ